MRCQGDVEVNREVNPSGLCDSLWSFYNSHSLGFDGKQHSPVCIFKEFLFFFCPNCFGIEVEQLSQSGDPWPEPSWSELVCVISLTVFWGWVSNRSGIVGEIIQWRVPVRCVRQCHLSHCQECTQLNSGEEKFSRAASYRCNSCVRLCLAVELYQKFKEKVPLGDSLHISGTQPRSLTGTLKHDIVH